MERWFRNVEYKIKYPGSARLAAVRFRILRTMFEHEPNILFGVWFNQIFEPKPEWRFRFGVRMNANIWFRTEHFGGIHVRKEIIQFFFA